MADLAAYQNIVDQHHEARQAHLTQGEKNRAAALAQTIGQANPHTTTLGQAASAAIAIVQKERERS